MEHTLVDAVLTAHPHQLNAVRAARNARYALNTRLQKFHRGGFTGHQSVNAAVTEIKEACDELERAIRNRKVRITSGLGQSALPSATFDTSGY